MPISKVINTGPIISRPYPTSINPTLDPYPTCLPFSKGGCSGRILFGDSSPNAIFYDQLVEYLFLLLVLLIIINIGCLMINCYSKLSNRFEKMGKKYTLVSINDTSTDTEVEISNVWQI